MDAGRTVATWQCGCMNEQARLLRSPGRRPQRRRRRPEEGLSPAGDETPSGPQSGRPGCAGQRSRKPRKPTKSCPIRPSAALYDQHGHAAFEHGMGGRRRRAPASATWAISSATSSATSSAVAARGRGARRGADLGYVMELDLEEAVAGIEKQHRDPDAGRLRACAAPVRRTARSTPARPATAMARCACSAASSPCSSRARTAAAAARRSRTRARPAMARAASRKTRSCR